MAETPNIVIEESLLAAGAMVDHFRIMRQLGAGGMGEVYLARDTRLGRKVALKLINPARIGTPSAVESFLAEAQMTARFSHPHIVTIYAVGEHEGRPYLALEYLEGQTLRQRMREEPPSPRESLRVGLAIADALREAHRMQVLHRDLKPENVLLPKDGRLRVVDFGIAKMLASAFDTSETIQLITPPALAPGAEKRELCGTPAYIAPELWQEEPATAAVDIWALGTILYELFVGQHPFEPAPGGVFMAALLGSVLSPDPVRIDEPARSESPELAELIEQCLSKSPGGRPSADQLVERCERLLSLSRDERRAPVADSPFRGLQPFSEEHTAYFFGREAEVAAFLERVRVDPVLPVLGPSGAGKSSFVQAGVIPMMREQGRWTVIRFRPGNRPFLTLAARVLQGETMTHTPLEGMPTALVEAARASRVRPEPGAAERLAQELEEHPERLFIHLQELADAEGTRILLFIDQLEELYTLVEDERVRRSFMRAICSAADDPADPVRVIFTLRDDFLGRVAEGVEARNALSRVTVIRNPGPEALREIVTRAVQTAGYRFDQPDLVQRMVAEVQGEPACLALLQYAARVLWERRDEQQRLLLAAAYEEIGGVAGALADHADGVLAGMSATQVRVARDLLLRLVTAEGTRRILERRSALEGLGDDAEEVLGRLVQARLVTVRRSQAEDTAEAELELVHESLIKSWGRLTRWVDESREDRSALAEVAQAAELWEKRGRREEEVWYGEALHEAQRSVERSTTPVAERVTQFLQAGQRREQRRQRRRRLLVGGAGAALFLVALVSLVVAMIIADKSQQVRVQRDRAEQRRREVRRRWAEAQREGARAALGRGDLLEARAKLRGAVEAEDSSLSRALWWQLQQAAVLWRRPLGAVVYDVGWSPDGERLAAACQDRTVYLFDAQTAQATVLRGHADQVIAVAFSPDGGRVASGSIAGVVRLVDLRTRAVRHLTGAGGVIRKLAFSPRGDLLAAAVWDKTIRIWSVDGVAPARVLRGHTANVSSVVWSPDGRQLVSAGLDETIRVWDVARERELSRRNAHPGGVFAVAYSPTEPVIASSGGDKLIRVWKLAGDDAPRVLQGHTAGVTGLAFGADGRTLISGSLDRSIRVWSLDASGGVRVLGHTADGVNSIALSPRGRHVASAGRDKTVQVWDLDAATRTTRATDDVDLAAGVLGVAFSPDGQLLAAGSLDSTVRLWDTAGGTLRRQLGGHSARVFGVAFSPDGRTLASSSQDKTVRLWELASGTARVLEGHADVVRSVTFSPDGKLLASGAGDGQVRLWDVASGALRRTLTGHTAGVYSVDFSADGRLVAAAGGDRTIRLWQVASGAPAGELTGHTEGVNSAVFSADGRALASGSWDRTVRVWDLQRKLGRVVGQHEGRVYWLDYHPRGQIVGAPSSDGLAILWHLDGSKIVLAGHQAEVNYLRFSPDGRVAATGSDDGTVRLWEVETGRPRWRAPLLYAPELLLFSHRGRVRLDGRAQARKNDRWRQAVDERGAEAAVADGVLCLRTHDSKLELWELGSDRQVLAEAIPKLTRVLAHPAGCVTLGEGQVRLYSRSGSFRELASGATAVASQGSELLIARAEGIALLGSRGEPVARYAVDVGVSAMLPTATAVIVGFKEGTLEIIPRRGGAHTSLMLEEKPSSPVVALREGPMGTLFVGFANGLFGLWETRTGSRLHAAHLHGPVVHTALAGGKLYVASELGDAQVLDLAPFHVDYCQFVRDVWRDVHVVWEDGLAMRRRPPADHRCARRR